MSAVTRELTMPKLSDSMADAVIVRWLKSPGEAFSRGEGLIEVETDKATVVYEAEWDGTLDSILVPEGGTAAVGQAIATLANGEGAIRTEPPPAPVLETPVTGDGEPTRRPNASPVAKRTAVELGDHGRGRDEGGRRRVSSRAV
jgi:pyruvate dehydrogenase E2 component (dihydrolipoamide acetyltransferase)